jgi:hypothetical protein
VANFSRGGEKAREESKKSFPSFARTNYLRLKDKESVIIRLIDDSPEWIFIAQHSFVPTKGAPKDWESKGKDSNAPAKKWPETMNAVCRKARNEGELVFPEHDGKCFICDEMTGNPKSKNGKYYPSVKVWARAVVRDAVIGTEQMVAQGLIEAREVGKTVGFQDRMIEIQETDDSGEKVGEPKKVPDVVVVNYGQNFFGPLQACFEGYGTVLDRDYRVTRNGDGLKTEYNPIPMEHMFEADENGKSVKFTLENEAVRAPYLKMVDLEAVVEEQASDRHFATFFDTTQEIPTRSKAKAESGAESNDEGVGAQAASPASTTDQVDLQKMRDRLMENTGA